MSNKKFSFVIACCLWLGGCTGSALEPAPVQIFETSAVKPPAEPTFYSSPVPTDTIQPAATASPTAVPSPTPTPTEVPLIISTPVMVDLARDAEEGRPLISGNVRFVDMEKFRIFYTLAGEDAVVVADENGNAIPDYVELVADALQTAWDVEVNELGWSAPPPDEGLGGDDRYDVYLKDLDWGYIGFARADQYFYHNGDNPNSEAIETSSISSHIVIDNDFIEYSDKYVVKHASSDRSKVDMNLGEIGMRISIAHELMHMIQYGYDAYERTAWLWEATASWVERLVYPDHMNIMDDVEIAFEHPDICQLAYGKEESAGHWYSEWLLMHFLAEKYGNDLIKNVWEQTVQYDGYEAIDKALAPHDTQFIDEIQAYHLDLLISNFGFDELVWVVRLEGTVDHTQMFQPVSGVGQMGADYIRITADGIIDIRVHQLDRAVFVGIQDDVADLYYQHDHVISVDMDRYQYGFVIVMNLEQAIDVEDCSYFPYQLSVSRGKEAAGADTSKTVSAREMPLD